jgi:hypothetical protein
VIHVYLSVTTLRTEVMKMVLREVCSSNLYSFTILLSPLLVYGHLSNRSVFISYHFFPVALTKDFPLFY